MVGVGGDLGIFPFIYLHQTSQGLAGMSPAAVFGKANQKFMMLIRRMRFSAVCLLTALHG